MKFCLSQLVQINSHLITFSLPLSTPSRDDTTHVALKFIDSAERRVRETIYGREYTVRAELTKPNSTNGLKVKNCFAFSKKNSTLKLIDERGCSLNNDIITRFKSNSDGVSATAMMKSMFKFPDGSEVHLQCDIVPCTVAGCAEMETCAQGFKGRSLASNDENLFLAATTVFVLDPADAPCKEGDSMGALRRRCLTTFQSLFSSGLCDLRGQRNPSLVAAVGDDRAGRALPHHVAHEHLPVHGHELQLCKD